jgi:hypothetical protein
MHIHISVGKYDEKMPLKRHRCKWEDNIEMFLNIYDVHNLKRKPATIMYYGTKITSEAGTSSCNGHS